MQLAVVLTMTDLWGAGVKLREYMTEVFHGIS